jgi:hypothetical protein
MKLARSCIKILCVLCLAALAVQAQTTSGSMSGTVTDPNAAVVPGAKVVALHEPTQSEFNTVTTDAGLYVFPTLPVGPYTISVTQPGFKKLVQTGVEIRVNLRQTLDLKLEIGEVSQSVEVKAELALLETTTAMRGQNVSPQLVATLPIFTGGLRNAESFVSYMPGVNSWVKPASTVPSGAPKRSRLTAPASSIPSPAGFPSPSPASRHTRR